MKNLENLREVFVANPWMLFIVLAPLLLSNTHFLTLWTLPRKLAAGRSLRQKPTTQIRGAGETIDTDQQLGKLRVKIWDISITTEHYITLLLFAYAILLLAYREPIPIERTNWDVARELLEIIWAYFREMVIKLAGYCGLIVKVVN